MGIIGKINLKKLQKSLLFFETSIELFQSGKFIISPMDSMYVLLGTPFNQSLLQEIEKFLPQYHLDSCLILINSIETAQHLVQFNTYAEILAKSFWPGQLSLKLARNEPAFSQIPFFQKDAFIFKSLPNYIIHFSNDPVISTFFSLLKQKSLPEIMFAIPLYFPPEMVSSSISEIIDNFGLKKLSFVLNAGNLTKDGIVNPNSIVDLGNNQVKMLQEGSISENAIISVLKG